jgi:phage terminase small subunit
MPALRDAKQEAFCQEYAKTGHGKRSLIAAGYSMGSTGHAATLLSRPAIANRIREITGQAMNAADITPERVMREIGRVAFQDVRDLFDDNGDLLPVHMLNDDVAATVAGIDVETRYEGKGDNAVPVTVKKIRRVDKMTALNTLAKHFKIIGDEGDGVSALASALADRLNNAKRRMSTAGAEDARIIPRGALEAPAEPAEDGSQWPDPFATPIMEPAASAGATAQVAIPVPAAFAAGAAPTPQQESDDVDELWN